jgi:hypothetical protein
MISSHKASVSSNIQGDSRVNVNIFGDDSLTPGLNPSAQCCLPRFFTGDINF